jgi:hypothetical protein
VVRNLAVRNRAEAAVQNHFRYICSTHPTTRANFESTLKTMKLEIFNILLCYLSIACVFVSMLQIISMAERWCRFELVYISLFLPSCRNSLDAPQQAPELETLTDYLNRPSRKIAFDSVRLISDAAEHKSIASPLLRRAES